MENPPYFDITAGPTSAVVNLANYAGEFSDRVNIFHRGTSDQKINHQVWFAEREDEDDNRLEVFQLTGSLYEAVTLAITKIMERWEAKLGSKDVDRFIAMEQNLNILGLGEEDFYELRAKFAEEG
jgi:hypothetical protein